MFKYYSDKRVIEGIKKGELKIYRYLKERFLKQIIKHVKDNSSINWKEDGSDLYQDSMLELIRLVKDGRYKEDKWKFKPTFEKIYKWRWLKIIKKAKPLSDIEKLENHITEDFDYKVMYTVYDYVEKLDSKCQGIFAYEKDGFNLKEAAEKIGISHTAIRRRKSRCLEKLRELMEKDGFT